MSRSLLVVTILLLGSNIAPAQQYDHIAKTAALTPVQEKETFKLPAGFEAQLVASEPDVGKPMNMAFDNAGRLWVTVSEEYPFAAQGRPGKDRVLILEDFAEDGHAKKITTFANDLNIPLGVCPLPDGKSVIVSSIPSIWRLTDTNGDGKADQKEELYTGFGFKDTHGMINSFTLMPDGWIYACHGFSNDSYVKAKDGSEVRLNSGNTFRFRPDGSRIEQYTRGQVNPFGFCFDEYFHLYNADCHSKPITQMIQGGAYSSFGKPHDGMGFAPEMIRHGHDSTALCGLVYYQANQYPKEYQSHFFLGNVTGNRINLDRLVRKGASPEAENRPDFLISTDPWFRPVDIKLGHDGALYVADFYNKIIGHYEVPLQHPDRDRHRGRIWRIVYKPTVAKTPNINLARMSVEDLSKQFSSNNIQVRKSAIIEAQTRKQLALPVSKAIVADESMNEYARIAAGWVVVNSNELPADVLKAILMGDRPLLQVHFLNILKMNPKLAERLQAEIVGIRSTDFEVLRAKAETLAAVPNQTSLNSLLKMVTTIRDDAHYLHSSRLAVRKLLSSNRVWDFLNSITEGTERAWLNDIILGYPSTESANYLFQEWVKVGRILGPDGNDRTAEAVESIARNGTPDLISRSLERLKSSNAEKSLALKQFQSFYRGLQNAGKPTKQALELGCDLVEKGLESKQLPQIQTSTEIATQLQSSRLYAPFAVVVRDSNRDTGIRQLALQACSQSDPKRAVELCGELLRIPGEQASIRNKAVELLGQQRSEESRKLLLQSLLIASSATSQSYANALANSVEGCEAILQSAESGKISPRLLQDKVFQTKLQGLNVKNWRERVNLLTKNLPTFDEKINRLIQVRTKSFQTSDTSIPTGKLVFEKHCAACHQIANQGSKIGPQLDGIGLRGLERIMEDTLDPNRNVDAAFRQSNITLKDGRTINGLVLREEGKTIILADANGKEVRIESDQVEDRRLSTLSPMPANWSETIPEKEYLHLVRFLLSQRPKE
jgi:putative heme-binding domain-containing protein